MAISTAYVPGVAAEPAHPSPGTFDDVLRTPPAGFAEADNASPRAAVIELAPPQPAVARGLRLPPGQPAISVTIRFDNRATGIPVGLTAVTMKPQYFRVVIQTGDPLPRDLHPPEPWAATVPSPRPPAVYWPSRVRRAADSPPAREPPRTPPQPGGVHGMSSCGQ